MRAGLALIVLILDFAAIVSILGTRLTTGRKLMWCTAVMLVPPIGALFWLTAGRARLRRPQHTLETVGSP